MFPSRPCVYPPRRRGLALPIAIGLLTLGMALALASAMLTLLSNLF